MDAVPGAFRRQDPFLVGKEAVNVDDAKAPLLRQLADEGVDRPAVGHGEDRQLLLSDHVRIHRRGRAEPEPGIGLHLRQLVQEGCEAGPQIVDVIAHLVGAVDQDDLPILLFLQEGTQREAALMPVPAGHIQPGKDAAPIAEAEIRQGQLPIHAEAAAVGISQDQRVAEPFLRHRMAELRLPLRRQHQPQDDRRAFRPGQGPLPMEAAVVVALHDPGAVDRDHRIQVFLRDLLQVFDLRQYPLPVRLCRMILRVRKQGQSCQQHGRPQAAGRFLQAGQVLHREDPLPETEFRVRHPPLGAAGFFHFPGHIGLQHELHELHFRQGIPGPEGPVLKAPEDVSFRQIAHGLIKPVAFRNVGKAHFLRLLRPTAGFGAGRDAEQA